MTGAEVISPICLFFIQGRFVTKYVARYLLLGAAAFGLLYIVNQHVGDVFFVPFIILGLRVFVKGLYSLGYYANGKLFPTLVKTTIFSLTNGLGRPFSALSTMVTEYTENPGEIFLFTSLIFISATTLLPESDDTESEIEAVMKKRKAQIEKEHATKK